MTESAGRHYEQLVAVLGGGLPEVEGWGERDDRQAELERYVREAQMHAAGMLGRWSERWRAAEGRETRRWKARDRLRTVMWAWRQVGRRQRGEWDVSTRAQAAGSLFHHYNTKEGAKGGVSTPGEGCSHSMSGHVWTCPSGQIRTNPDMSMWISGHLDMSERWTCPRDARQEHSPPDRSGRVSIHSKRRPARSRSWQ